MGKSALKEVGNAVFSVLHGDATLQSLVSDVFGRMPVDQSFPYIVVTAVSEVPFDTFSRSGKQVSITVDIYSDYRGMTKIYEITERVGELLDRKALSLTNFSSQKMEHTSTDPPEIFGNPPLRSSTMNFQVRVQQL